jgi:O-antigen/teichoic acid export membrane protein
MMMHNLQKWWHNLLKPLLIYSASGIVLRSISFLIIPFALRYLSPQEYGQLALLTSFITIGTTLAGLGLRQVLAIEYFHRQESERSTLIKEIITIYCVIIMPLLIILFRFPSLTKFFLVEDISTTAICIALISIFLTFFNELTYQLLQYTKRASLLAFLQISAALCAAAGTCALVCFLHSGYIGVLAAQCVSISYVSIVSAPLLFKNFSINKKDLSAHLQKASIYIIRGFPFIPGILCSWLLACGNRWLLAHYSSLHAVGIYAIADTCCQVFYFLVLNPWSCAYIPHIFSQYSEHKQNLAIVEHTNQKTMWLSMITLFIAITVGFFIGKPFVLNILPAAYHESLHYVLPLMYGQIFLLGSYFNACIIQFHKRTYLLALLLLIPASISLLMARILIMHYATYGCVFANVIGYICYFVLTFFFNRRIMANTLNMHPLQYDHTHEAMR